jgi:hypothetical protein
MSSRVSAKEFEELFAQVCNWGRWGPNDQRGTLNFITAEHVRAAAGLVRWGRTISFPANQYGGRA